MKDELAKKAAWELYVELVSRYDKNLPLTYGEEYVRYEILTVKLID